MRSAVSTVGSIVVLIAGVGCGVGSGVCSGMGWEQKAVVCMHGVGIFSGIASGLNEADPVNPAAIPGRLLGDVVVGNMNA